MCLLSFGRQHYWDEGTGYTAIPADIGILWGVYSLDSDGLRWHQLIWPALMHHFHSKFSGFAKFSFRNPMIIRIFGIHWKTLSAGIDGYVNKVEQLITF
jgi:hypothetical protein